jgi:hypothetical protein
LLLFLFHQQQHFSRRRYVPNVPIVVRAVGIHPVDALEVQLLAIHQRYAAVSRYVVEFHDNHSITVTANQMIKPTGTPITPASNNNTNSNCRTLGGGIPPTGISTSVVSQEHLSGFYVPLYLLNIFSLIAREHRRSLARFPLA